VDGNKRTALLSAFFFLLVNGYRLNIIREKIIDLLIKIADRDINDIDRIAEKLEELSEKTRIHRRFQLFLLRLFWKKIDLSILEGTGFYRIVMENLFEGMEESWPE